MLEGLDRLRAVIADLKDKTAKKAAKAGVNAGLAVLAKEMKARVNGLPISGELKAALRATINKRLKKKEGQEYTGKAGFGVGKQTARKKEAAHARAARGQGGAQETRGVGISSANVHWAMGTQERVAQQPPSPRQRKIFGGSGEHRTGRMPDVLGDLVEETVQASAGEVEAAAAAKVAAVMAQVKK